MIKSLLSCNQECARARPWDPFSGSREVFMGSLNEPRCSIGLRLTLATLQFGCIFTHSWSGGRLRVAKMVLWLCGPTDGNRSQKGSHLPLRAPWKLGASTGLVINREERQARQAQGKTSRWVGRTKRNGGREAPRVQVRSSRLSLASLDFMCIRAHYYCRADGIAQSRHSCGFAG
jgi:hypothetical protein